jgi:hypothetical protein
LASFSCAIASAWSFLAKAACAVAASTLPKAAV